MEKSNVYQLRQKEDVIICIDKSFMLNSTLTLGAKGLMLQIIALKSDKVFPDDFESFNFETKESIEKYISELIKAGYLEKLF